LLLLNKLFTTESEYCTTNYLAYY